MSLRLASFAVVLGAATIVAAQPAPAPTPPTGPAAQPAAQPVQPTPVAQPAPAEPPPAAPPPAPPPMVQPPPPPPPPAEIAPPPAVEVAAPPAEAPLASRLGVGSKGGFMQPALLLQGWFLLDKAQKTTDRFRLRRAEFGVKGEIVPKLVGYGLMLDAARALEPVDTPVTVGTSMATIKQPAPGSASTILNDFYITLMSEYLDVSLGQFKIPLSWEGYNSASKLIFAERALISRLYGDKRDMGVKLTKTFKYFGYFAGLYNGAGQNNLEVDKGKDGTIRVEAYPVEGFTLAAAAYATLWDRKTSGSKDRIEFDARYEHGPVLIQAEYIRGTDKPVGGGAGLTGQGFYIAGGYYVLDELQPVLRFGWVDPNTKANADPTMTKGLVMDEVMTYEVGLNYYISKQEARLLLNYSRFQYDQAHANNEVIAGAQVSY